MARRKDVSDIKIKKGEYLPCECGGDNWLTVYISDGFHTGSHDGIFQCAHCGKIYARDKFIKTNNVCNVKN